MSTEDKKAKGAVPPAAQGPNGPLQLPDELRALLLKEVRERKAQDFASMVTKVVMEKKLKSL